MAKALIFSAFALSGRDLHLGACTQGAALDTNAIAITDQYLRYMQDACIVASRDGKDYSICTVNDIDLASKAAVDTLAYAEDAGTNYPKLLNNQPTDRFAQLEVVFSTPKGGTICWLRLSTETASYSQFPLLASLDGSPVVTRVQGNAGVDYGGSNSGSARVKESSNIWDEEW